MYKKMRF